MGWDGAVINYDTMPTKDHPKGKGATEKRSRLPNQTLQAKRTTKDHPKFNP
jgi:hypothetical protein